VRTYLEKTHHKKRAGEVAPVLEKKKRLYTHLYDLYVKHVSNSETTLWHFG
jgi:hypothetical protein